MVALDWLARLNEEDERYVLLLDLEHMPLAELAERLLLGREASTQVFWTASGWHHMTVADALALAASPELPLRRPRWLDAKAAFCVPVRATPCPATCPCT